MHLIDRERRIVPAGGARAPASRRRTMPTASASATIEAVAGGASAARATGSAAPAQPAIGAENLVFVELARAEARDENLPHAAAVPQPHRMPPPVPGVEVADHRNAARVRRPDREAHARDAIAPSWLRAKAVGNPRCRPSASR